MLCLEGLFHNQKEIKFQWMAPATEHRFSSCSKFSFLNLHSQHLGQGEVVKNISSMVTAHKDEYKRKKIINFEFNNLFHRVFYVRSCHIL